MQFFNLSEWKRKYDRKYLTYLIKILKINYPYGKTHIDGFYSTKLKQNWRISHNTINWTIWKIKKNTKLKYSKYFIQEKIFLLKKIYWYENKFFYIKMLKFRTPWPNKKYLNPPKKKKLFSSILNIFFTKKLWCLISIWSLKDDLTDFYIFLLHDFFFYTNNLVTMEGVLYFYFIEFIDFSHLID